MNHFQNGVVVYNTTPHPISIQDVDGTLVSVQPEKLLNASPVEESVSDIFVTTKFVGTEDGEQLIREIQDEFEAQYGGTDARLVIVGSIIAAQAYRGKVAGLCPVPGYERVAPAEKRMRCDKFTVFQA